GVTQPHPNMACILVGPDGSKISEAYQRAQGTTSAEVLAVTAAGGAARGATAYLNLESGDCHGEMAAVDALVRGGVSRVVVGLRHPLRHLRSRAIGMLRAGSFDGDDATSAAAYGAMSACLAANEALLHRSVLRRPLGVLKYAMTLDGKIATNIGHSSWVSSPQSRGLVFEMRARSDAVIVGGNTVRRDNPRLTTRREGGHTPARIVMSRTLDLPEDANLWDVTLAPTIVLTQRGARTRFQAALRSAGVEVVEFDFLTPESVADYCQERGFLQCFWECGGTLAAPTIASGVVHKVMAFVAPKIIGGVRAPTPVGELGFVEMTQAVELSDTSWSQVGPDLMMTGYMPASGGLWALEAALEAADEETAADAAAVPSRRRGPGSPQSRSVAFYKAWDRWGALSNFSPHPIVMPVELPGGRDGGAATRRWASVEHYYQAHKFSGGHHQDAAAVMEAIAAAPSPEEAARIGRRAERTRPELLRRDWATAKVAFMHAALRAKFSTHPGPRAMLLATAGASPHDYYWGAGYDRTGQNKLGRLLMQVCWVGWGGVG
ncbi:hypothetical protein VOLCADRAFT_57231, partial [Volvox carteri f. nagariensis]